MVDVKFLVAQLDLQTDPDKRAEIQRLVIIQQYNYLSYISSQHYAMVHSVVCEQIT